MMSLWLQHLLVLLLVAGCVVIVAWQGISTLRGRKSALGKCCAKGCDAGSDKPQTPSEKIHFIPSDLLRKR